MEENIGKDMRKLLREADKQQEKEVQAMLQPYAAVAGPSAEVVKETGKPIANPKIEDRRYYRLTDDEIKRMRDATATYPPGIRDNYHCMLLLMLTSGLRRDNVVNLRVEQVDWENQALRIKAPDIKTRISTIAPFTEETARYLRVLIGSRTSGYVFMHKTKGKESEKRYTLAQINNIIGSIGKRAQVAPKENFSHVNPHLLRHTWVRKCKEAGIPKEYVRAAGGWTSFKMIDEVYGQAGIEELAREFKKVNW